MTQQTRRRAILEKRLAELIEELEAVQAQTGRELSESNKLRLKREATQLEREITEMEKRLDQGEQPSDAPEQVESNRTDGPGSASKYNIHIENASGLVIGDHASVTQHFDSGGTSASESAVTSMDTQQLVALSDQISRYFGLEDVRDLCFRLGIEYSDLGRQRKSANVQELVVRVERNGRLSELIVLLQQLRPHVSWQ